MPRNPDTEASLEHATMALFKDELHWDEVKDVEHEKFGAKGTLGRVSEREVVLMSRLLPALRRLSPDIPEAGLLQAAEQLISERGMMSTVKANQEVYSLLKDGAAVSVTVDGEEKPETVRFIDWDTPTANHFFLASQFWIAGQYGRKRMDLVGFINGIPLVLLELKAPANKVENAYYNNLSDYKTTIPQLFWYNAFIILSNGRESRIGTLTSSWEYFAEWKRVESEEEPSRVSLPVMLEGTCAKTRLLDLVENFTLFSEERADTVKILAKNHQYLGVNNAVQAARNRKANAGRLGVFWHTQGSGKSYSMIFFAQKVLRKLAGNWSFLILTDRVELDEQIYGTFLKTGAVTKENVQATSGENLRTLLLEDNRYIFTLIQKFRNEPGQPYPLLSNRDDVIVITDEAHRSQYAQFAKNLRDALPNAGFLGFTGTPLMAGEELTREVFGEYVSTYDFADAIDDNATVPLYHENRVPEVQLTNENFNEEMQTILDNAILDEAQEAKFRREFSREYHVITRDDRLDKIAEDVVNHFMNRGQFGKAMFMAIDKMTAVRMYHKVQRYWGRYLYDLRVQRVKKSGAELEALEAKIRFMEATDMAVVVSQSQNEIEQFQKKGLDIAPHRKRIVEEDLAERFKDAGDTLRLVFVCAMWLTGFDAPSVSTLYLDKPMRGHTLMQAIARANRVWGDKNNGLLVDYIGIFKNLEQALAIYGSGSNGQTGDGELPVKPKEELVAALGHAVRTALDYLVAQGIDVPAIEVARGFERVEKLQDAFEALLISEDTMRGYLPLARKVDRLYRATLPSNDADAYASARAVIVKLLEWFDNEKPKADISDIMAEVETLLDESVAAEPFVIHSPIGEGADVRNLADIDFERLREQFEKGRKRTEAEKLKRLLSAQVQRMVRLNRERIDYVKRLQALIDAYNAGSSSVTRIFDDFMMLLSSLSEEEQRHAREGLSEEELAVFDLLIKPAVKLTAQERESVKTVARGLLAKLKWEKLVLDWRKRQQTRAAVRVAVEETLDALPASFEQDVWQATADAVFEHISLSYEGAGKSVYT